MSRYRVTREEFLQLYGPVPECKYLYDVHRTQRNGNIGLTQEEVRSLSKSGRRCKRQRRALSFWKTGGSIRGGDWKWNDEAPSGDEDDTAALIALTKDKGNPVTRVLKRIGRVMFRHFYFMNVAVENTGGVYVVRYGPHQTPDQMQVDYCYTSSYATSNSCLLSY